LTALRVPVEIAAGDMRVWRLSETIDVGTILFAEGIPFDRGTRLRLRFRLPGGAAVGTEGDLVAADEIRLHADSPARRAIERYLEEQANP
jgi:hypothetical protein